MGVFHAKGWWPNLRALPRKFVFIGFRREESGMSRDFCRMSRTPERCSRSLCKKSSCAFFVPYQRPTFPGKSLKFSRKSDIRKFQAPKFENSEPEKMQFHTPSHAIPPLDSLLLNRSFLGVKERGIQGEVKRGEVVGE